MKFSKCVGSISFIVVLVGLACLMQSATNPPNYDITDIGRLSGVETGFPFRSTANGINDFGQVVGVATPGGNYEIVHAFRTAANSAINPATDDLGTLGGSSSYAYGINNSGQVVGFSLATTSDDPAIVHAFRTAANSAINPATDDLGGGWNSHAYGINDSGQVVGDAHPGIGSFRHAFRTAANSPINPATDDLGTLGGSSSYAYGINNSGQVVGGSQATTSDPAIWHAFRTAANSPINPATDDLGTLGGSSSYALGINNSGQVVGFSETTSDPTIQHAFRTAANSPINPATDDLGTLGGPSSHAYGINDSGEVVGSAATAPGAAEHAFLYSGGVMYDLNNLIPRRSEWRLLLRATGINAAGQIVGYGILNVNGETHGFRMDPKKKPKK